MLEADTSNEMLVDTSSSSQPTSLDELHSPYDNGDVHHFAHSLKMLLKGIKIVKNYSNTTENIMYHTSHHISTLRQIKTYLRSTMGQERLKVLLLMNVHYAMTVDISTVVDSFARKHSHRMVLINILQTSLKFSIT